ncbi:MAG: hypothetical protein SVV03_02330 [Candidatus Nanohaloarchaea archaeon]|nr:hypothetical protein [Candidatus Nanohaloarchaea archaeon]
MAEEKNMKDVLYEIVQDPKKAEMFLTGESEEAEKLRDEVRETLNQAGESTRKLFEEKTGKSIKVSLTTLAWIAVTRHLIENMDCRVDDAEELWYIG